MPKRFSERILEFLREPGYEPMKADKLARAIGIAQAQQGDFHDAVDALRRVGRVVLGTNNAIMLPHPPSVVVGTYRGNPRGFGFVVPDEPSNHGDLYIASGASLDAITGDTVRCRVIKRGKRGGRMLLGGRVIKVIERGDSRFVGRLYQKGRVFYVEPDGNALHGPIMVGDGKAKNAKAGDQVVVEITRYPREGQLAQGVIVERLGKGGRPGIDLLSIIRQYHLPEHFSEEVLSEARRVVRGFDMEAAAADRVVLSDRTIITIDPDDARDYDDAISLERLAPKSSRSRPGKDATHGGPSSAGAAWELGVHIADVSALIPPGSALDQEAKKRGTSVYFPGRVVPMLPETLSNGLCSLQEGEPRACKSVFIRYDAKGCVVSSRFANTIIRSAKRLTYREATSILETRGASESSRLQKRHGKAVVALVRRMNTLARAIQKRRITEGMIVLDIPAVDLVLDNDGKVIDAKPEDTSFSHTIIEMFMVEANEAAGRLLNRLSVPFLRRIHPAPDDESLEAMARFVIAGGMSLPKKIKTGDLQRLLKNLRGRPEGYAVNLAVLKSMQIAEYSPKHVGHFALASKCYTHFTSPIRRYPDLMIHRLLELHLSGHLASKHRRGSKRPISIKTFSRDPKGSAREGSGLQNPTALLDYEELVECGKQFSYLSRRAESAERELKALKVLTLLMDHLGDGFDGIVTGVTQFGLFVQHPKYLIDGLLRLEDLGDDWWEVDVKAGRVVGECTRRTFVLGSKIAVQIASVDISSRQLNLSLGSVSRRVGQGALSTAGSSSSGRRNPQKGGRQRNQGLSNRARASSHQRTHRKEARKKRRR